MPLGHGNPCGLPFPAILVLNLCETKKDTRHETSYGATEVELLRNHHDAYPPFTPLRQQIHALALAA